MLDKLLEIDFKNINFRFSFMHAVLGFLSFVSGFLIGFVDNIFLMLLFVVLFHIFVNLSVHYTMWGTLMFMRGYMDYNEDMQYAALNTGMFLTSCFTGMMITGEKNTIILLLLIINVIVFFGCYYAMLLKFHKQKVSVLSRILNNINATEFKYKEGDQVILKLPKYEEHPLFPKELYDQLLTEEKEVTILNLQVMETESGELFPIYAIETKNHNIYNLIKEEWLKPTESDLKD